MTKRTYRVYVIRLRAEVLAVPRFAKANPGHRPHKPCVYVGSTWLSPEERYAKHLSGIRSSPIVRKYHLALHKRLTAKQPEFDSRDEAERHEALLASRLRRRGYAVWSH